MRSYIHDFNDNNDPWDQIGCAQSLGVARGGGTSQPIQPLLDLHPGPRPGAGSPPVRLHGPNHLAICQGKQHIAEFGPSSTLGAPACSQLLAPDCHQGSRHSGTGSSHRGPGALLDTQVHVILLISFPVCPDDRFRWLQILVNTHCYEQWRLGSWWQGTGRRGTGRLESQADKFIQKAMLYLHTWPQWRQSNGARFVVTPMHPAIQSSTRDLMRPCKYVTRCYENGKDAAGVDCGRSKELSPVDHHLDQLCVWRGTRATDMFYAMIHPFVVDAVLQHFLWWQRTACSVTT